MKTDLRLESKIRAKFSSLLISKLLFTLTSIPFIWIALCMSASSQTSDIDIIHKIQRSKIMERTLSSVKIENKIKTIKNLNEQLTAYKEITRDLNLKKNDLIKVLTFSTNREKPLNDIQIKVLERNLEILYRFILQDYPFERNRRLKIVSELRGKLSKGKLKSTAFEEYLKVLNNEINICQIDKVRNEGIMLNNEQTNATTFSIGRVGYYFINEEKKLTGFYSLKDSKWKLVNYKTYGKNFKKAIDVITADLSKTYVLLPIELASLTHEP